ncbi:MAG TPA: hypothetical protein VIC35_02395 [Acidimicrobiia bacterium]|jgi:hypothetical protein
MADVEVPATSEQELDALDRAEEEAEHHLARRVILGMVIAIPVFTVLFGALVGLSVHSAGSPAGVPLVMGAGIGVLAGIFFGTWGGIVASVHEVEDIEHDARVSWAEDARTAARHGAAVTSSPSHEPEELGASAGVVADGPVE